jgi:hypothetical protein
VSINSATVAKLKGVTCRQCKYWAAVIHDNDPVVYLCAKTREIKTDHVLCPFFSYRQTKADFLNVNQSVLIYAVNLSPEDVEKLACSPPLLS